MKTSIFLLPSLVLFSSYSLNCLKEEEKAIDPVLIYNISRLNEEWGGGKGMDPILLLNISKLNKKWDDFNYEELERLQTEGDEYDTEAEGEENWKNLNLLSSQRMILNNETILLTSEIISWYRISKYEHSIVEENANLLFEVGLVSFDEEVMSDSINSPRAKIDTKIHFYNKRIPFKSSIPFELVKFKGNVAGEISCPSITFEYTDLNEGNENHKRKKESFHCYVNLDSDGGQSYSVIAQYIKIELDCIKDFTAFPFDSMKCEYFFDFQMHHDWRKINYTLDQNEVNPKININDYYLEDMKINNGWSITWTLRKKHGYYIYTIYLPISLLVFVSWLSFFLGTSYSDVQMRLDLVVTILLTLITVIQGINNIVPKSPQYKASDHWSITSVGFVIAAMVAIVANRALLWCKNKKLETALENEMEGVEIDGNDEETQSLYMEEVDDTGTEKVNMGFPERCGLCTTDTVSWAKSKAKLLKSRKSLWCARIMNICAAVIFPLMYLYFVFNHIEKYCSFEKFWDNKYFESVTNYQGPNKPPFLNS